MRCTVQYMYNDYGNSENAPRYHLSVEKSEGVIRITFALSAPAAGQGVGDSRGEVQKVTLSLPNEAAAALAPALQLAAVGLENGTIEFDVDEDSS